MDSIRGRYASLIRPQSIILENERYGRMRYVYVRIRGDIVGIRVGCGITFMT